MSGSQEMGASTGRQSRWQPVLLRILALTAVVLAAWPIVAAVSTAQKGTSTWAAAGLAAGICWLGATMALVLLACFRDPKTAVQGVLLGMVFRLGLPLVGGLTLSQQSAVLRDAGFFGLVLIFYFVTLATETLLAVSMVNNHPHAAKAS